MTNDHDAMISQCAALYNLDPVLVKAVVEQESNGNTFAFRPERGYRYLWNVETNKPYQPSSAQIATNIVPPDFPFLGAGRAAEYDGQRASWGLMQVMGAVARELQFRDPYLSALCEPALGLVYGCKHLAKAIKRTVGNAEKALSIYNSGRPDSPQGAAYASEVLRRYNRLSKG